MGVSIIIFELILLSTALNKALATVETQEQLPLNENQPAINNIGSLLPTSKLTEVVAPGKSTRYIIRFARTPNSQIRFSRSPTQIRFGRSQSFVRFGRNSDDGTGTSTGSDKFIRFARNGIDDAYVGDENLRLEPRARSDSDNGFIRFGRSQGAAMTSNQGRSDGLRSINWRNFARLGRNTNAHIRFAGKRDGNSGSHRNVPIPIELLVANIAQQQQHQQSPHTDATGILADANHVILSNDVDEQLEDFVRNSDQLQSLYTNGNDAAEAK